MVKSLKIACYGYAEKSVGSVAGANFLILEELLQRGFEIDFFGWPGFTEPEELFGYKNFRYVPITTQSKKGLIINSFPKPFIPVLRKAFDPDRPLVNLEILKQHTNRQYDLVVYLGTHCPDKIAALPVISWVQGPPRTEWMYIHKNRSTLFKVGAFRFYLTALIYYTYKDLVRMKRELRSSDLLISGSQWSTEQFIRFGINSKKLRALPYPINTEVFNVQQKPSKQPGEEKTFLWLGRIDSRKRLDLLLDAYKLVLQERKDVYLKIRGDFSHTNKHKKLLDQFEFPKYIEYKPFVNRSEVPNLFSQCDILIQPSEAENFGSSVAEALCCGLPVIVGPTNGTKDYISASSFVFEEYSPEALKESMLKSLNAVETNQAQLISDARSTAEKNFSVSKIVDGLEDIFSETISLWNRDTSTTN
jgi:glycosyltransferase involved in cell wall biosynthesis